MGEAENTPWRPQCQQRLGKGRAGVVVPCPRLLSPWPCRQTGCARRKGMWKLLIEIHCASCMGADRGCTHLMSVPRSTLGCERWRTGPRPFATGHRASNLYLILRIAVRQTSDGPPTRITCVLGGNEWWVLCSPHAKHLPCRRKWPPGLPHPGHTLVAISRNGGDRTRGDITVVVMGS